MDEGFRWKGLALTLVAIGIGALAYFAGGSHGIAAGATTGDAAPAAMAYYWRPWAMGVGFFPFGLLLWLFVFRFLFRGWCGRRRWGYRYGPYGGPYGGPYDGPRSFDEWHRQAHERMNNPPKG